MNFNFGHLKSTDASLSCLLGQNRDYEYFCSLDRGLSNSWHVAYLIIVLTDDQKLIILAKNLILDIISSKCYNIWMDSDPNVPPTKWL